MRGAEALELVRSALESSADRGDLEDCFGTGVNLIGAGVVTAREIRACVAEIDGTARKRAETMQSNRMLAAHAASNARELAVAREIARTLVENHR